ncbi:3392_t:CDS:2 [Ambispora gerdemannii]|uniref:3392_t:CDS:1 n=1 Tax=Ambispora gerdemannii TaxID=144530 RepID=A0A9N9FRP6_9GLOM|nr:3392_t:CDS:2 [Ambispora gerdemannii]
MSTTQYYSGYSGKPHRQLLNLQSKLSLSPLIDLVTYLKEHTNWSYHEFLNIHRDVIINSSSSSNEWNGLDEVSATVLAQVVEALLISYCPDSEVAVAALLISYCPDSEVVMLPVSYCPDSEVSATVLPKSNSCCIGLIIVLAQVMVEALLISYCPDSEVAVATLLISYCPDSEVVVLPVSYCPDSEVSATVLAQVVVATLFSCCTGLLIATCKFLNGLLILEELICTFLYDKETCSWDFCKKRSYTYKKVDALIQEYRRTL